MESKPKKEISKKTDSGVRYEDLEGKLILFTIGNESNPATEKDLNQLQKKLQKEIDKKGINCVAIVGNHTVTAKIIEKQK